VTNGRVAIGFKYFPLKIGRQCCGCGPPLRQGCCCGSASASPLRLLRLAAEPGFRTAARRANFP